MFCSIVSSRRQTSTITGRNILLPCNYQLSKIIVHGYSCHVNINNLPYSDRYFDADRQLEMFKRGKPMDMILVKCISQNRFP